MYKNRIYTSISSNLKKESTEWPENTQTKATLGKILQIFKKNCVVRKNHSSKWTIKT